MAGAGDNPKARLGATRRRRRQRNAVTSVGGAAVVDPAEARAVHGNAEGAPGVIMHLHGVR